VTSQCVDQLHCTDYVSLVPRVQKCPLCLSHRNYINHFEQLRLRRWAVLSLFEPFKMIDFEMRWIFIGGSCKTFSTFGTWRTHCISAKSKNDQIRSHSKTLLHRLLVFSEYFPQSKVKIIPWDAFIEKNMFDIEIRFGQILIYKFILFCCLWQIFVHKSLCAIFLQALSTVLQVFLLRVIPFLSNVRRWVSKIQYFRYTMFFELGSGWKLV